MGQSQSVESSNGGRPRRRRRNSHTGAIHDRAASRTPNELGHGAAADDNENDQLDGKRHSDHTPRTHHSTTASHRQPPTGNGSPDHHPRVDPWDDSPRFADQQLICRPRSSRKSNRHLSQHREDEESSSQAQTNGSSSRRTLSTRSVPSRIRRAMGRKSKRNDEPLARPSSPSNNFSVEDGPPSLVSMDEAPRQSSHFEPTLTDDEEEDEDYSEEESEDNVDSCDFEDHYGPRPRSNHDTTPPASPVPNTSSRLASSSPARSPHVNGRSQVVLPAAPISPAHRGRPLRVHQTSLMNPGPRSPTGNERRRRPSASRNSIIMGAGHVQNEESLAGSSNRSSDTAATAAVGNHAQEEAAQSTQQQDRNSDYPAMPVRTDAPVMGAAEIPPSEDPSLSNMDVPSNGQSHAYHQQQNMLQYYSRRASIESTISTDYEDDETSTRFGQTTADYEFFPRPSRNHEWMGRSIESLVLGHASVAPILALEAETDDDTSASDQFLAFRRRSTASTFGGRELRRRSSQGTSYPGQRRGSLSLTGNVHGGTLANYYSNRRRQQQQMNTPTDFVDRSFNERMGRRGSATTTGPMFRRRSSVATNGSERSGSNNMDMDTNAEATSRTNNHGPNAIFSILARETTGKASFSRGISSSQALRTLGGTAVFAMLDKPAAGMATEVAFLAAAIDAGDWTETHTIVSRLAPRLTGDPMAAATPGDPPRGIDDANLPPTAPKFHAGGGRLGLERDAFCLAGGVEVMIRMFREKSFVGQEMSKSYDARDLSEEIVANRLAGCWNEVLVALRELVYAMPTLVEEGTILDNGDFLPFLFTLLAHDSCFEAAAALIEEILSLLSQAPQQTTQSDSDEAMGAHSFRPSGRVVPATTFYLGNVPHFYRLWSGFSCRQLAHFCRILALLVFEPEDRQLLESPAVLKSIELLQLRRNRAVRAGRDSTVDMNQSILLGDEGLTSRLLKLLLVMNFAPSIRRVSPYHIMAHNPFIVDTLLMLGFSELESWEEIDRQNDLARELQKQRASYDESASRVSQLGSIADWLEDLSETLNEEREPANQILRIMTSAQQAGLVLGSGRRRGRFFGGSNSSGVARPSMGSGAHENDSDDSTNGGETDGLVDGAAIQGLASFAGMLTDQVLVRRLYQNVRDDPDDDAPEFITAFGRVDDRQPFRHPIQSPSDAANNLQFNAMILGPYQVEVLFVLCTLLGGRRKLDAQDQMQHYGLIPVLEEMFERLPWFKRNGEGEEEDEGERTSQRDSSPDDQQPNGIHGPGCECTPESALCVQYLRLLHNFCDRDCDNYEGRRLLLSDSERAVVFLDGNSNGDVPQPGLLSKIIGAFMGESDESPYRFWLASCIESYLRGSSPEEQLFVAKSGLMDHLVRDVSSERLHCAGSLQTSFDLLGELGKGNAEAFKLLVSELDEEAFRKLMGVAATNLVDSNVFIRSLLLSLERLSASNRSLPLYVSDEIAGSNVFDWVSPRGAQPRSYLTHSWWDQDPIPLQDYESDEELECDVNESREVDWFPSLDLVRQNRFRGYRFNMSPTGSEESVGLYGWLFSPAGESFAPATHLPNSIERLFWFLAANQARLLRDLLGVVDLRNINHENICCLNTAVVIAIFAHRRQQLAALLQELRQMNSDERESNRRALGAAQHEEASADRTFLHSRRFLDMDQQQGRNPYSRVGIGGSEEASIGDRSDALRNFREVLWFWREYYTHRGRDRLSLEFSSHLRFEEWDHVVSLLAADDASTTALVPNPVRLPRSPYQRSARVAENPLRGL